MAPAKRARKAGSYEAMSCEMLPGLMLSPSPVTASSLAGNAQNPPGSRGKEQKEYERKRQGEQQDCLRGEFRCGANVDVLPPPYAETTSAVQHSTAVRQVQRQSRERLPVETSREQQEERSSRSRCIGRGGCGSQGA
jgi:hypothetical protein